MNNKILLSLCAMLIMGIAACKGPGGKTYKIGYMICNSKKETVERFGPLNQYLLEETGCQFTLMPVDTVDFEETHKKEQFDFAHTNSVLYIIMNKEHGMKLVATEKNGMYGARTAGTIIVRKDSPIKTLKDLKGKKMIFGPTFAPFGYVTQTELLQRNGIDTYRDLKLIHQPAHSFQHEKIIYGVWFGSFDAGAAPLLDLEEMERENKIKMDEDFRILAKTEIHPYCTFASNPNVPADVAEKVKQALLKINKDTTVRYNNETVNLFRTVKIEGYEVLEDKEYDALREILKKLNFPPYQRY